MIKEEGNTELRRGKGGENKERPFQTLVEDGGRKRSPLRNQINGMVLDCRIL